MKTSELGEFRRDFPVNSFMGKWSSCRPARFANSLGISPVSCLFGSLSSTTRVGDSPSVTPSHRSMCTCGDQLRVAVPRRVSRESRRASQSETEAGVVGGVGDGGTGKACRGCARLGQEGPNCDEECGRQDDDGDGQDDQEYGTVPSWHCRAFPVFDTQERVAAMIRMCRERCNSRVGCRIQMYFDGLNFYEGMVKSAF